MAGIAAALHARGHDVTLFGLDGSAVAGVEAVTVAPSSSAYRTETTIVDKMERLVRPDVLFDHSLYQLAQSRWPALPAVTQSHGWATMPDYARNPVFCSAHHGRWHGVKEPEVALINVEPKDYTVGPPMVERGAPLFLGRIVPYKRVDLAVDICADAGLKLTVAGPAVGDYFAAALQPRLDDHSFRYVGEVAGAEKAALLSNARCLMFTSEPSEPSGTVMLEAMASGTPVFAFDHGANPEYVRFGVTGFLWPDDDAFIESLRLRQWLEIDPAACRRHVEENFSPAAAADRIELLLERAAKGERW